MILGIQNLQIADKWVEIVTPNHQDRVVRKPVNANPGLKVNFSCLKVFFTAYVLDSLRLFKRKTEG